MALADYVCKEAVCVDLDAADRGGVLRALLERFVAAGALEGDLVDDVLAEVLKRERLGSTAIGRGVALPHTRSENLKRVVVGFAQCPGGVEFNALDGEPVHQVFLVLAGEDHHEEYVAVMERITRLVQNEDFRRFAAGAQSADAVFELIEEMAV